MFKKINKNNKKRKLSEVCGQNQVFMIWNFAFIASFQSFRSSPISSTSDLDTSHTQPCINCGFWTGSKALMWQLASQAGEAVPVRSFHPFMGTQCPPLPLSHSAKHLCKVIPTHPTQTRTPEARAVAQCRPQSHCGAQQAHSSIL